MKYLRLALPAALLATLSMSTSAIAQHNHSVVAQAASTVPKAELAEGEVRRIDPARGTILLKHGEIKSIGMGAMTMSFKFKDPKMATGLAVGDKVQFAAEQKGDDLIVTQIVKKP